MSTAFSQRMQGTATRLLSRFGSTVTLVRAGAKVWDAEAGEYVQQPDMQISLTAVPVPVAGDLAGSRPTHFMGGTAIEAGDMQVICDAGVVPSMEDKIIFNNEWWSVVAISPSRVNNDVLVYFILVRK